jgi:hypothetical protein
MFPCAIVGGDHAQQPAVDGRANQKRAACAIAGIPAEMFDQFAASHAMPVEVV